MKNRLTIQELENPFDYYLEDIRYEDLRSFIHNKYPDGYDWYSCRYDGPQCIIFRLEDISDKVYKKLFHHFLIEKDIELEK